MIEDLLDLMCAEQLGVDVETFITKIENTTEWRREVIILNILDTDNQEKIEQAKRCF